METNHYILNITSERFRYSFIICEEEIENFPSTVQYKIYYCAGNIKKRVSLNTVIEFIKNKIPSDSIIKNQPGLIFTNSGDIMYLILVTSNFREDLTHAKYSIRQVK